MENNNFYVQTSEKVSSVLEALGVTDREELTQDLMNAITLDCMTDVAELLKGMPEITNLPLGSISSGKELLSISALINPLLQSKGVDLSTYWDKSVSSTLANLIDQMAASVNPEDVVKAKSLL